MKLIFLWGFFFLLLSMLTFPIFWLNLTNALYCLISKHYLQCKYIYFHIWYFSIGLTWIIYDDTILMNSITFLYRIGWNLRNCHSKNVYLAFYIYFHLTKTTKILNWIFILKKTLFFKIWYFHKYIKIHDIYGNKNVYKLRITYRGLRNLFRFQNSLKFKLFKMYPIYC